MKNLKSIVLCGILSLGLLFMNVTPTFAATGHDGMVATISVNGAINHSNVLETLYPYKMAVNQKFSVDFMFIDDGHDHLITYSAYGASGLPIYINHGWESGHKLVEFPEVSFSTPGRHVISAVMACQQTGQVKSVTYYVDVV
ncbi:hypothetical protein LGL55_23615 [Clostridium tagluense]|uniref:hypothetical protein n=1 Tax=Clostridium tagluense TaxID=360422 RepID=UPI001C0AF5C1|nr:hypothetical protein [Clostridium tagluense]MBU3127551.1 hypothetical protein [Clostridium tagluense]MBW9157991.1 hypothetical protein [Clostridium tagluense]MCB2314042.1 hypothetical protein [Clostridium tagluense]MCB2318872.1 hypothetical protein [Clostridium tagluense]MCB2323767.1 hypothetical protein [Clostridium tagluense]